MFVSLILLVAVYVSASPLPDEHHLMELKHNLKAVRGTIPSMYPTTTTSHEPRLPSSYAAPTEPTKYPNTSPSTKARTTTTTTTTTTTAIETDSTPTQYSIPTSPAGGSTSTARTSFGGAGGGFTTFTPSPVPSTTSSTLRTSFGGAGGEFTTFTPSPILPTLSTRRTSFGGAGGDFTTFTPSLIPSACTSFKRRTSFGGAGGQFTTVTPTTNGLDGFVTGLPGARLPVVVI